MAAVPQSHVDSALLILALRGHIVLDRNGPHLQTTTRRRHRHLKIASSLQPTGGSAVKRWKVAPPSTSANSARRRSHTLPQQSLDRRARTVSQARRQRMQVLSRERSAARNPFRAARASARYRGTR